MHAKTLALASAVAMAASVAAVQPEHPRIYFPREIKREYHNGTVTSSRSLSPPDVTPTTSSTRRDLLSDLISEILGSDQPVKSGTKVQPAVSSIVVETTVPSDHTPPEAALPKVTVGPPTKTKSEMDSSSRTKSPDDSDIVIGPTGIVSSAKQPAEVTPVDPTALPTAKPTENTPVDPPVGNNTVPEAKPTKSSTENGPVKGSEPSETISVKPPAVNTTVPEATPTKSGGLLDPIGTLLSSLLPDLPVGDKSSKVPKQTETSSSLEQPIPANSTKTAVPTIPTTEVGLLPSVSLLPIPDTTKSIPVPGLLPNVTLTETSLPSTKASIPIPVITTTTSGSELVPNVTTSSALLPTAIPTNIPIGNTTSTTSDPISSSVTDAPVTNGTISAPPAPEKNSTVEPATTSKPVIVSPTTKPQDITASTVPTEVDVTVRPTATSSQTDNALPSTNIEPTTFSSSTPTVSQGLPTTIPKAIIQGDGQGSVPTGSVAIHIGFKKARDYISVANNSTAYQEIFDCLPQILSDATNNRIDVSRLAVYRLAPYNTQATRGYFTTLALLNYPTDFLEELKKNMKIFASQSYQNKDPRLFAVANDIDSSIPLTGELNDEGSSGSGGGAGSGKNGNSNNNNKNNDAFGSGNQGNQSSKQKATAAGMAMAAVGVSAICGAAMFIVARRYKRKRQGHRRTSSITSSQDGPEMRFNRNSSPALMGGALLSHDASTYGGTGGRDSHASGGNSARTANISAPVATENSLGWN
ncbi:hypothetical protein NOR_06958 [Metarhizium rileyi]|uniref:Basic proline-rich protein n=1 Tax=Metarhizium rileyi (strain RCEF 4871) TaxID=1649241 RepID=A0A166ZG16_METRR|nr:hypothetical protein NOR_06958 [Metarhizium rileyi RCEF 4871]